MPFQVSPGVETFEKDLTNIVPGVSTSIGAHVGSYQWGPVEQIVTVSREEEVVNVFGKPNNDTFISFFAAADFLAYSDNLKLLRMVGEDARNAASGGDGTGLTLDTTVLNGIVQSVLINAGGTNYVVGDLITIDDGLTDATLRVTSVANGGVVDGMVLLTNGTGYVSGSGVSTTVLTNVLVKNEDDFDDTLNLPEVVAKYPGAMGNSLLFSAVRASEFDNWAFKNRFVAPPTATTLAFNGTGAKNTFALDDALASDAVVTVDGVTIENGADPGQYQATSSLLTFNVDDETFTADGSTEVFTLTNTSGISTAVSVTTLDGTTLTNYTGAGEVPAGQVKVSGNTVTYGLERQQFSGDGVTSVFTVSETGIDDARVTVDGTEFTVTASAPAAGEVQIQDVGSPATATSFTFNAGEVPGIGASNVVVEWGFPPNTEEVVVTYGYPSSGTSNVKVFSDQNEIHAVVSDAGADFTDEEDAIIERWEYLSLTPGNKKFDGTVDYYIDAINQGSRYVWIGTKFTEWGSKRLSGGVSDDAKEDASGVTPGLIQQGWANFKNSEVIEINHLIGADANKATALYLIGNIAEYRKDCVAYLSPPRSTVVQNPNNEADDVVAWRSGLGSTSYATLDSNWKYRYDQYNDVFRWVPCSADHAGCYARTHDEVDPWFPGAGFNRGRIKNATRLAWSPDKTDRDTLYSHGVNPITTFVDEGPILIGDKTLQTKPSAFDRMNVRWLFIVLEKAIAKAARYFLFELNNEYTRNRFRNMVNPFLRDVQGRQGITDYEVRVNGDNNSGPVIDRNEFVGDILVKPSRSINFITLNFVAVGTEVNFNEV